MSVTGIYRHFKGKYYEVLGLAADGVEEYILYRQLYEPYGYWLRPRDMFFGERDTETGPVPRFARVAAAAESVLEEEDLFTVDLCHSETPALYRVTGVRAGAEGMIYQVKPQG